MYFPYFRGKQYEWIAVRELSEEIADNGQIIPIFEPVKKNFSAFLKAIEMFNEHGMPFIIIANPLVGDFFRSNQDLIHEIKKRKIGKIKNSQIGYLISEKTKASQIKSFFKEFKSQRVSLIHCNNFSDVETLKKLIKNREFPLSFNIFVLSERCKTSRRYRRSFRRSDRVMIEDGFQKRKNEDYPDNEFFSDLHLVYDEEHYKGFGDFLIVGDTYSPTGGPAYAVAIHLTYIDNDEEIWVKHFVSDTNGTPVDPAGKFIEALEKLVRYVDDEDSEIYESEALAEFRDLYKSKHFPGLGYVKKLSMKHHIELIDSEVL